MTTSTQEQGSRWTRPFEPVGKVVSKKIGELQEPYLNGSSTAKARLARLRRSVTQDVADVPAIWEDTLSDIPLPDNYDVDDPTRNDNPTCHEVAAHVALTLYALHQQSRTKPMHVRGLGFGTAIRRLAAATDADVAVTRRFAALVTASDLTEVRHHMRGLINQLRTNDIPLDYGLLADDFVALQDLDRASNTRLRWGRDFHRAGQAKQPDEPESTIAEPENGE